MPKAILKIDRFEGGLNQHADPRDVGDNEASELIDAAAFKTGAVSLSGSSVPFIREISSIAIREPGWGLFACRSDYDIVALNEETGALGIRGGTYLHPDIPDGIPDQGLKGLEEVDCLYKLFDPVQIEAEEITPQIHVRESHNEEWTELGQGLDLYSDFLHVKRAIRPIFEVVFSYLRISDANLAQYGMFTKWFGVISDTRFINKNSPRFVESSIVATKAPTYNTVNSWLYTHAECRAPWNMLFADHKYWANNSLEGKGKPRLTTTAGEELANNSNWITDGTSSDLFYQIIAVANGGALEQGDIVDILGEKMLVYKISSNDLYVRRNLTADVAKTIPAGTDVFLINRTQIGGVGSLEPGNIYNYNWGSDFYNNTSSHAELTHWGPPCQVYGADFTMRNPCQYDPNVTDYVEMPVIDIGSMYQDTHVVEFTADVPPVFGDGQLNDSGWPIGSGPETSDFATFVNGGYGINSSGNATSNHKFWGSGSNAFGFQWSMASDGFTTAWTEHDGISFYYSFERDLAQEEGGIPFLKGEQYKFWISLIYDGEPAVEGGMWQESGLTEVTGAYPGVLKHNATLACQLRVKWTGVNADNTCMSNDYFREVGFNLARTITDPEELTRKRSLYIHPRVTGCRVYYSTSENNDTEKYLLLESWFNEDGGVRKPNGRYQPWLPIDYSVNPHEDSIACYYVSTRSDTAYIPNQHHDKVIKPFHSESSGPWRQVVAVDDDGNYIPEEEQQYLDINWGDDHTWLFKTPPITHTYTADHRHEGKPKTEVLYKTSCSVGTVRYVGNIGYPVKWKREDDTGDAMSYESEDFDDFFKGKMYGDRIIRCVIGMPDVMPETNFLEISPNDGDSIVKMASFGQKMLIFKKRAVYIVNVEFAENEVREQLEKKIDFHGVSRQYHVCETDLGIAWMNKFGVYIYNGEEVSEITSGKIDMDEWNWTNGKSIGYDPIHRTLIIMNTIDNSSDTSTSWIYYIIDNSWSKLSSKFPVSSLKSNFVNDQEGRLLLSAFNSTPTSPANVDGVQFIKDIDEEGNMNYFLKTISDTPVDSNGETFSFNNFYNEYGPDIFLHNTGLKATSSGHPNQFIAFGWRDDQLENYPILNSFYALAGEPEGLCLLHGDILDLNGTNCPDTIYMWTPGNEFKVVNVRGFYQVETTDPISFWVHSNVPPGEFALPQVVRLIKRTDIRHVSNETSTIGMTFAINNSTMGSPETDRLHFPMGEDGSSPQRWEWNHMSNYTRKYLVAPECKALVPQKSFFDGYYRISKIESDTVVHLETGVGDARVGIDLNDNNRMYAFNRLHQGLPPNHRSESSNLPLSLTPEEGPNEDYIHFSVCNLYAWDRSSTASPFFKLATKELDFGSPGQKKKVYKCYLSYSMDKSHSLSYPKIRVLGLATTSEGSFYVYPDVRRCQNYVSVKDPEVAYEHEVNPGADEPYNIETLEKAEFLNEQGDPLEDYAVDQKSQKVSTIYFSDPSRLLNNCTSFKLILMSSGLKSDKGDPVIGTPSTFIKTHPAFELNDISIIYRLKSVK